ncbi:hypothetical protein ABEB36_010238 [Hypothenemus hampei]|uniref:DNA topoisomerase (ATP-hydrolyzing) n=1 Tax=Hypothenemus hampei TaxID=57062 RepID=A0ABD1EN31_HYPHA
MFNEHSLKTLLKYDSQTSEKLDEYFHRYSSTMSNKLNDLNQNDSQLKKRHFQPIISSYLQYDVPSEIPMKLEYSKNIDVLEKSSQKQDKLFIDLKPLTSKLCQISRRNKEDIKKDKEYIYMNLNSDELDVFEKKKNQFRKKHLEQTISSCSKAGLTCSNITKERRKNADLRVKMNESLDQWSSNELKASTPISSQINQIQKEEIINKDDNLLSSLEPILLKNSQRSLSDENDNFAKNVQSSLQKTQNSCSSLFKWKRTSSKQKTLLNSQTLLWKDTEEELKSTLESVISDISPEFSNKIRIISNKNCGSTQEVSQGRTAISNYEYSQGQTASCNFEFSTQKFQAESQDSQIASCEPNSKKLRQFKKVPSLAEDFQLPSENHLSTTSCEKNYNFSRKPDNQTSDFMGQCFHVECNTENAQNEISKISQKSNSGLLCDVACQTNTTNDFLCNSLSSNDNFFLLFTDSIINSFLDEKQKIKESYEKNLKKLKNQGNEEDSILAENYIKKYRKQQIKIFLIKRRLKETPCEIYQPPEHQVIDRFIEKANNDFQDDAMSNYSEDEYCSTPKSYVSDEGNTDDDSIENLTEYHKLVRNGINKLSSDEALVFSRYSDTVPKEFNYLKTLTDIQGIFIQTLEDYENGRTPCFQLSRATLSNCVFKDKRHQIKPKPLLQKINYMSYRSRSKFNIILLILNKIMFLLESGKKITGRELYYQFKTMYVRKDMVDRAVADIGRMVKVGVWALNVMAQKGLVFGNLKLIMTNGEEINCNVPGTMIPIDVMEISEIHSNAYFILVVEKESIFHKLLEEDLPNRLTRPFILITGKGVPDLNTKLFLKKLWMVMSIPVFIFVDADPGGIGIMLNYRFGSVACAHVSEYLAIPKARWIGVFPHEILEAEMPCTELSKRDIVILRKFLNMECVTSNEKIKYELEKLLEIGIKMDIEGLMKTNTYLSHQYLSKKLITNEFI